MRHVERDALIITKSAAASLQIYFDSVFVNKEKKCSGSPTWQHKDCGRPACGARELLEFSPGVDGIMDQRFASYAGQVEGTAGDEQA